MWNNILTKLDDSKDRLQRYASVRNVIRPTGFFSGKSRKWFHMQVNLCYSCARCKPWVRNTLMSCIDWRTSRAPSQILSKPVLLKGENWLNIASCKLVKTMPTDMTEMKGCKNCLVAAPTDRYSKAQPWTGSPATNWRPCKICDEFIVHFGVQMPNRLYLALDDQSYVIFSSEKQWFEDAAPRSLYSHDEEYCGLRWQSCQDAKVLKAECRNI